MFFSLFKNALGISVASIAGQVIFLLSMPLLTRLFSPSEFGLWAIFVSISVSLGSIASGRLELAMLSRMARGSRRTLLYSAIISSLFFSIICVVFVPLLSFILIGQKTFEDYFHFILLIPIGVFIIGLGQTLNHLALEKRDYRFLAIAKLSQNLATVFVSLIVGMTISTEYGLIFGYLSGLALGQILLWKVLNVRFRYAIRAAFRVKQFLHVLEKLRYYPNFVVPAGFLANLE